MEQTEKIAKYIIIANKVVKKALLFVLYIL